MKLPDGPYKGSKIEQMRTSYLNMYTECYPCDEELNAAITKLIEQRNTMPVFQNHNSYPKMGF